MTDLEGLVYAAAEDARKQYYLSLLAADRADAVAAVVGAGPHGNVVASALADAFLAVAWRVDDLRAVAASVIGGAPSWLQTLVDDVISAYPMAPTDRPRELARYVARLRSFRERVAGAPGAEPVAGPVAKPVRVVRRLAVPTTMVRRPFHTPIINDLADLAQFLGLSDTALDWFADRRHMNRRAFDQRLQHYRYLWLNGRLVEAPKPRLRELQRHLLAHIVGVIPTHPAAHGFVPGRSPHTFGAPHACAPMVIRLDITSFFAAMSAARAYGVFRAAGYPEPVAHTLAALCTTRTPPAVCRSAAATVPDRAYRLALLRAPHLPQGAPTSPALANLGGFRLDRRLSGLARSFNAHYTRYADDLAFSGALTRPAAQSLVAHVTAIAADEGFRLNPAKTRIRSRAEQQRLAGLVVNARPAVPRQEYDSLRALLHNAARTGLDEQNRAGLADFRGHVLGRIAWVGHRHPVRAAKLAELLATVP